MSEEAENSGGGSFKNILIGLASTIAVGVGGFVTKQLTGEEETAQPAAVSAPAPVINITQQQAQQAAPANKTIIVERPAAGAAPAPAPKPKPKTAKEELEEAPKW